MICSSLAIIVFLLLAAMLRRRQWLSILTAFFIFAVFIIWGLVSVIPLGATKDSIFDKSSYLKCYQQYKVCTQRILNIFK